MYWLGQEVDLVSIDRTFLEKHRQQQVTVGVTDTVGIHISQEDVAGHGGKLQIFVFTQKGVGVGYSVFADLGYGAAEREQEEDQERRSKTIQHH